MSDNKINLNEKEENNDEIILNKENISINIDDLIRSEDCIECVLNEFQKKMESSPKEKNIILKQNEIKFKKESFSSLLTPIQSLSELKEEEKYTIIIDLLNFYNFEQKNILNKLFNHHLTEKGILILLCDLNYLNQIGNDLKQILGEDNKIKMLIKLYIVSKFPFFVLFSFQKIMTSKDNINILNEKIMAYEIYEDLTLTKPLGYTLDMMPKSMTYMSNMFLYQNYLNILHPGKSVKIHIKEAFWSDNVLFSTIICDSDNEEIIKKKNCAVVILGQSYLKNFVNLNKEANLSLCNNMKYSRLIIIRPNPFNPYTIPELKDKLSSYIKLFNFKENDKNSVPIMMINDENENVDKVFIDNKVLIREIKQKEHILRQFISLESPHEIQAEIKVLISSKSRKNKDKKSIPIHTIERYSSKNLGEYLDDTYLSMFYSQNALSAIFFLNYENYPQNKKKVLVLGAGIGNICYFMDKILANNVQIDAVEIDPVVVELGRDYFGLNNYKKENNKNVNIKWYIKDPAKYIEEKDIENYYDLIIMNINNTNYKNERSPPDSFFEEKIVKKINKMLSEDGIYIMYLMSKNSNSYKNSIEIMQNNFKQILFLENNDDLNKIHFCFKTKKDKESLLKNYTNNIKILSEDENNANIKIIEQKSIYFMNMIKLID